MMETSRDKNCTDTREGCVLKPTGKGQWQQQFESLLVVVETFNNRMTIASEIPGKNDDQKVAGVCVNSAIAPAITLMIEVSPLTEADKRSFSDSER